MNEVTDVINWWTSQAACADRPGADEDALPVVELDPADTVVFGPLHARMR